MTNICPKCGYNNHPASDVCKKKNCKTPLKKPKKKLAFIALVVCIGVVAIALMNQ